MLGCQHAFLYMLINQESHIKNENQEIQEEKLRITIVYKLLNSQSYKSEMYFVCCVLQMTKMWKALE